MLSTEPSLILLLSKSVIMKCGKPSVLQAAAVILLFCAFRHKHDGAE